MTDRTPPDRGLLAGWASRDITPSEPVQIQGQFYERISETVRDPLTATAWALEQRGHNGAPVQAVLVSCDLTNIPAILQREVRRRVAVSVPDLDPAAVILTATHTHSAPVTVPGLYPDPEPGVMHPDAYRELAAQRIARTIGAAWRARQPGGVSRCLRHAALGYNRRIVYEGGETRMYGPTNTPAFRGLEGTCDHGVELVFCWDSSGGLTGVVVNVSCPSQVVMTTRLLSADFWAHARMEIRGALGDQVQVLPLCGAAGDQCPVDHVRRGRPHSVDHDEAGLVELGRRLARAVVDGVDEARSTIAAEPRLGHAVERIELPGRRVSRTQWLEARQAYEQLVADGPSRGSSADGRARRTLAVIARYHNQTESPVFPMEMHAVRLGDIAFATNPFELFLDYGLRIKARSPAEQTSVVQLAGDRGGYLPTRQAIEGKSYGAGLSEAPVGPAGGDVLVERTVSALRHLWGRGQDNYDQRSRRQYE